jgi:hypothetical protein
LEEVEEVAQHRVDSEEDVKGMRAEESFSVSKIQEEDQETLSAFALKVLDPLDLTYIAKYILQRTLGQYPYHDD